VFRLILRTAVANLRSRPVNSWLLALIIAGASASLTLAASLHSNASDPFDQTFRATNGADVHVLAFTGRDKVGGLAQLPGVRKASGPYEFAMVDVAGRPANARLGLEAMPLLLGIRERRRDFAIYKAVGVTPRQVLATVAASGSLLAVVAVVIGIPLGSVLFHYVVVATNPTDGPDLVTNPTWWWLLLALPATLVFTTIASVVPARQAAAVKPAEALRYE
jgi:FtsX-like permease family